MGPPDHLARLVDPRADALIRGIIELFELVFPTRVGGYYLLGSYSEGATVPLSDLDVSVLFRGDFRAGEEEAVQRLVAACGLLSPVRLDITAQSENGLRVEDVRLKLGSVLVSGEDVRPQLSLPEPEAHARYITDWTAHFLRLLHDEAHLTLPLAYPASADEFYGYARVRIPQWYPAGVALGTKELVATVCWAATALLSLTLGADGYVGTKGEAVRRYGEADSEWGAYVSNVYERCKGAWAYGIPEDASEREELRALCAQAVQFFNHYLSVYERYLLRESQAGDTTRQQWATERLNGLSPN